MSKQPLMAVLAMLLVVGLAVPLATFAVPQAGGGQAAQAPGKTGAQAGRVQGREPHPVIRRSIRQLENVKNQLQTEAAHDFGGHRVKAIEHINQALAELRLALNADKD